MKKLIAVVALLLFTSSIAAEAARKRTRVTVHPQRTPITDRMIYQHPYAVDYVLRSILCAFHVFSIGPQGKPGSCADHLRIPTQHRVV